jgi:gluconolactonase
VDLRTHDGAQLVRAAWRYAEACVEAADFVSVGPDLGPSGPPATTYDIHPHAEAVDFDDSTWRALEPAELELRLGAGLVSASWYRATVTIPDHVGDFDPIGATVVFEVVIDDYAEVWVDGELPKTLGDTGGPVVAGFNAPNRVILTRNAQPGSTFTLAVFGINGPLSAQPRNYIWVRSATLDFYGPERAASGEPARLDVCGRGPAFDTVVPATSRLVRIASGFESTAGPVWMDGGLLFSSPTTNTIYRWSPAGRVTIFHPKSGYAGVDIGHHQRPGSNGLAVDTDGRLVICQYGNRRIVRVNPHGDLTVLAETYQGSRLNSPSHLVFRSDGTLYFTDPPFGLPGQHEDAKKELPFSGVFRASGGAVTLLTDELAAPDAIAFSPEERHLYVGDRDPNHRAVVRYDVGAQGDLSNALPLVDLTSEASQDAIGGITVDRRGNLFVCGPGGIWLIAGEGAVLGQLVLPETPHDLAWGNDNGRTLYITTATSVYRLSLVD